MAFDAYLWFENPQGGAIAVEGETTDKTYSAKKAFEIYSFSWGASNPSTIGSGGGGSGGGRVTISSFNVMKKTDNASPNFFETCCNGGHYGDAHVALRKAGGTAGATGTEYLKYDFKEVFVDSIQWSGSTGGDDVPTESISFSFGACQITYTPQTKEGTKGKDNPQAWSAVLNNNTFAV